MSACHEMSWENTRSKQKSTPCHIVWFKCFCPAIPITLKDLLFATNRKMTKINKDYLNRSYWERKGKVAFKAWQLLSICQEFLAQLSVTGPKGHYPMRSSWELFFLNPKDQSQMLFNKTHVLTQCALSYLNGGLEIEKLQQGCVWKVMAYSST